MWELALGVISYLTRALGKSREQPERLFRDHVLPIHEDLLKIQNDYTQSLIELADLIADDAVPTATIAANIDRHRKALNPVRVTTAEMAKALAELFSCRFEKKPPPEDSAQWLLHRYTDAVIDYLYGPLVALHQDSREFQAEAFRGVETTMGTRYSKLMKAVEGVEDEASERARLSRVVRDMEADLERSWTLLSERYGRLKAQSLA